MNSQVAKETNGVSCVRPCQAELKILHHRSLAVIDTYNYNYLKSSRTHHKHLKFGNLSVKEMKVILLKHSIIY